MANNDPWDLGGGGQAFPFDHLGDEVEGYIQEMVDRQGTDMQSGELAWWDKDKTRPVMLKVLTVQTTLRAHPGDDGMRTITLSGSKNPNPDGTMSKYAAALKAVKEATGGGTGMQFNAWIKMRFTSEGAPPQRGFNPPKYYQAWYRPPVMDLDGASQVQPANQVPATYGSGTTAAPGANWPTQNTAGPNYQQQTGENYAQHAGENYQQQSNTTPGPISRNLAQNLDLPDANRYPEQAAPPPRQPEFAEPAPQQQAQPQVAQGGTLAGEPITAAAVQAIRNAGMNPDTVFGPGWQARVTG